MVGQSRDCLPDDRDRMGNAAISFYSPVLHRDRRWIFHAPLWRGLRDGWRAPITGRRPRARDKALSPCPSDERRRK
jgi:hypothetical protein